MRENLTVFSFFYFSKRILTVYYIWVKGDEYKNMKEFIHQDYTDKDGNVIPSVTQLLGLIGSEGLTRWANQLGLRRINLDKYMEDVSTAGSLTHDRIERYFKGEDVYDDYYGDKIEKIAELAFSRFKVWADEAQVEPIWIEKRFSNDRYGGTVDLLARVRKEMIMLIDFKTSKHPKPTHLMQLAGYLNLIKECDPNTYKKINFVQVVTLGGKGLHLLTRPVEDMGMYQDAFEKIYMMYCAYKTCIEKDEWESQEWK